MLGPQNVKLIKTSHFKFKRIPLIEFDDKTRVQKERKNFIHNYAFSLRNDKAYKQSYIA